MNVKSNVPEKPLIQATENEWSLNNYLFQIGDEVRIQMKSKFPGYPYAGNGYIGKIEEITSSALRITNCSEYVIYFKNIFLMRHRKGNETFETVPFYDEKEEAFWDDYWMTKDGIRKKTPEDKAMIEKFREKH